MTYVQLDEDTVAQNTENYSEPLDTFTLTYLYVAKADRDDDRIYDITKFTYENGDELVDRDSVMAISRTQISSWVSYTLTSRSTRVPTTTTPRKVSGRTTTSPHHRKPEIAGYGTFIHEFRDR